MQFSSENVTHFLLGHVRIMYQVHCTASNGKLGRNKANTLDHWFEPVNCWSGLQTFIKLSVHIFAAIHLSLHPPHIN